MADRPDDRFEIYYGEKLWNAIPGVYRHEDGIAEQPGVLRALVELFASQAAVLRRSQDRLWEDLFIELCDDWAVPYIGQLLATRLVSALNPRGRRVDVARTIYYRRRKGTLRVLEELIHDIAGWEGRVVEAFHDLHRMRHGLDPMPARRPGATSATPVHGLIDLRALRGAGRVDGPWDELAHTPDVRPPRGRLGRWNIPRLVFHLYRLAAYPLQGVVPFARADGASFTFDPSGRDLPLFAPGRRGPEFAWDQWRSILPWEVPAPISCRLLGHAEYQIEPALVAALVAAGLSTAAGLELSPLAGIRFASERFLRERLAETANAGEILAPGMFDRILAGALVEDCGKRGLLPHSFSVDPGAGGAIPPENTVAADLKAFTVPAVPGKRLAVDPDRGRFLLLDGAPDPAGAVRVSYHHGWSGPMGAGAHDRRAALTDPDRVVTPAPASGGVITAGDLAATGTTEVPDSATYVPAAAATGIQHLVVQAANFQRPYVRLEADWVFAAAGGIEATLELDGLWLGARGAFALVLRGEFEQVALRSMTLDPGGVDVDGAALAPVPLVVEGRVEELTVDRSVLATIGTRGDGMIDRLVVRDAILDAGGGIAVALPLAELHLHRVTVFGGVDVERLWATEALLTGPSDVTDIGTGCFRFSAAAPPSRLPHPYRSHVLGDAAHLFTSRRFGEPGYAQLSGSAPFELLRGAENGSEVGAWSARVNPIKLDSLVRKVEEFAPFGVAPAFTFET